MVPVDRVFTSSEDWHDLSTTLSVFINSDLARWLTTADHWDSCMAFIVQMFGADFSPASITIERREDALETALHLAGRGLVGVKIIGDGRIYNAAEFSLTVPVRSVIPDR